ncbi:toll/interleukin-1 receptor domain-containing protein [Chloroflexota bacterium]
MANEEHLKILKQGVEVWNEWRREESTALGVYLNDADLSGADLRNLNLREAELGEANLFNANLSDANLTRANLSDAKLNDANLSNAKLFYANLSDANLTRANLSGATFTMTFCLDALFTYADLSGANFYDSDLTGANLGDANLSGVRLTYVDFSDANLTHANLTGASLAETKFMSTCLKDVQGLSTCRHKGPSIVDHMTIQCSGMLPVGFLQGCGLPDLVIDAYRNLVTQPYYSCFISYSAKDQEFVDKLYIDLQDNGVRCWYAEHDIKAGKKVHEQIEDAIQQYDRLLLVLSDNSMNSEWVKTEIANARERASKEKKQILFPIRLVDFRVIQAWKCFDADRGKDSAREIREYFILDFQNWRDEEAYQRSFERLLRSIKNS